MFAPIAILIALYYRIAGFDRSIPFAGAAVAARRRLRARHRGDRQARRAAGQRGGERHLRHRLDRLARARAQPRAGEGLAHRGAGADGSRHRLGRREAALAVRCAGSPPRSPSACSAASSGTRASSAMRSAPMPVFNWLLWGYGVPAASFWLAGHMLRRQADDAPARVIDAAAILFTVMLIVFEVRHYLTGDPYGEGSPLAETALDVSLLLAVVIGLERLRLKSGSVDPRSRRAVPCRHRLHHDRVQPGGERQSLLHRRAGRRTVHQSDPARLRPAGRARRHSRRHHPRQRGLIGTARPRRRPRSLSRWPISRSRSARSITGRC